MNNLIWAGITTLAFIFVLFKSSGTGFALLCLVVYVFAVIYLLITSKENRRDFHE